MRCRTTACLLAALVAADAVPAAETCLRTVRWEAAQPPYNLRLPDGRQGGYYADLVVEILRRMGCQARLLDMRWPRGLVELQAGRLDIMAGMLSSPEREAFARFTRSVNLSPNRLYLSGSARRRYPALRTLADVRARLVGLPMQPEEADVRAVLTVAEAPALIGLSRKSIDADFADRFDATLAAMIADGTVVRLRRRYIDCRTDPLTLGCLETPPP